MPPEEIQLPPDKRYFKIGEVSSLTGLKSYVLRFWETEFPSIRPGRTLSGQRVYKREDVELILTIKRLLYEEKFTIPGARDYLRRLREQDETREAPLSLRSIHRELLALRSLLD